MTFKNNNKNKQMWPRLFFIMLSFLCLGQQTYSIAKNPYMNSVKVLVYRVILYEDIC